VHFCGKFVAILINGFVLCGQLAKKHFRELTNKQNSLTTDREQQKPNEAPTTVG
jgi:hypothetical protein